MTSSTAGHTAGQEGLRIKSGLQCPECYGVHISARTNRFSARIDGWLCTECGCQFSPPAAKGGA
jgi:ribosomal protein L37AE/L43A